MLPRGFSFFFKDTATTDIHTLSLHDALPISLGVRHSAEVGPHGVTCLEATRAGSRFVRSEEHTSELQSRRDLVCRLLLEKKKRCALHHRAGTARDSPAARASADAVALTHLAG